MSAERLNNTSAWAAAIVLAERARDGCSSLNEFGSGYRLACGDLAAKFRERLALEVARKETLDEQMERLWPAPVTPPRGPVEPPEWDGT